MKSIADHNTNIISQLGFLESLVTWPASFNKNIQVNKDGCCALSIDSVGRAILEIQILLYMATSAFYKHNQWDFREAFNKKRRPPDTLIFLGA